MPPDPESIQDILLRRREAAFVGRGGQLALFRQNFELPVTDERRCFVFNVHGEGGVGKSTLLEQWRLIARERGAVDARVDEHVYGVPQAMAALAAQLGDRPMKDFRTRYDAFLRGRERIERDPQAPPELLTRVIHTGVKAGLHATKALPGAAPVVDLINDESAAEAVDHARVFLTRKLRDRRDVRLLLSPVDELSPAFVAGLANIAARQPVVMFFDTFEQTGGFLEGWLLDLLAGRHGALPIQVTLVIAGRHPLDSNRWSEFLTLVAPAPLAPFTENETRQLLATEGVTDASTVEEILALTGGLPLLVETLARSHPANPSEVGDPTDTAVERFLRWEPDESRRTALAGALPRRINEDLLAAATGTVEASPAFAWLSRRPFVSSYAGRYQYHEVVRTPMVRWQRQRSPEQWRAVHARLADRYRRWREELKTEPDWSDVAWRDHQVEETYHRLCAGEASLRSVTANAIAAAAAGTAAARQWAEMVRGAGRDLGDDETAAIGASLSAMVGDDAADCAQFLTQLIQLGHLDRVDIARALVERARIHYYADRDSEAIDDCSRALQHDPQSAKAHAVRADALSWKEQYDVALVDFNRAVALNPDDARTLARRGSAFRMLGRNSEALADLNRAIQLNPDDAWAIGSRGEIYRLLKRYDEALADFNRAIQLTPDDAWAIGSRGQTRAATGEYEEALIDLSRAIQLNPNYAWAVAERGETHRLLKRYDEALADLNRAIEIDPDNAWAIGSRGQTYRMLDRDDEALVDFNRAIQLNPNSVWAITERGETHRLLKRYDEALADLNRAIEIDPDNAWAIGSRGQTYAAIGQDEKALADLNRAIQLQPDAAWAISSRGTVHGLLERYHEALADLNRALQLNPDDAWAIGSRGEVYRLLKRYDEALADLDRAIQLEPDDAWVRARRGAVHGLLAHYDEALTDLDRAIQFQPDYPFALASRGETYRLLERFDEALADLNRAIELEPDDAWNIGSRGQTYAALGQYEKALADLDRAVELRPDYDWAVDERDQVRRLMEQDEPE